MGLGPQRAAADTVRLLAAEVYLNPDDALYP
jgi:hypothetical protein